VLELLDEGRVVTEVAHDLGIGASTIYNWRRKQESHLGQGPGMTRAESEELKAARREVARLRMENQILPRANDLLRTTTSPKDGSWRSQ
jgi:transposase-like protein